MSNHETSVTQVFATVGAQGDIYVLGDRLGNVIHANSDLEIGIWIGKSIGDLEPFNALLWKEFELKMCKKQAFTENQKGLEVWVVFPATDKHGHETVEVKKTQFFMDADGLPHFTLIENNNGLEPKRGE